MADVVAGHICECGCGGTTKGGRFLMGHDAKLKARLINLVLDDRTPEEDAKIAEDDLRERGWLDHLEKSRVSRHRKAMGKDPNEVLEHHTDRRDDRLMKPTRADASIIEESMLKDAEGIDEGDTVFFAQGSGWKAGTVVDLETDPEEGQVAVVLYGNASGQAVQKRVLAGKLKVKA